MKTGDGPRLRTALVGCGIRGAGIYLPVLRTMSRHFELVALCDRLPGRAAEHALGSSVRAYTELDDLLEHEALDLVVLAVTPPPSLENAAATLRCIEAGMNVLAETPIAPRLDQADAIITAARRTGATVEVAENYWRTPRERFKAALRDAGVFGRIHIAYADYVAHGYHAIALLRSHLGFDVPAVRVTGLSRTFDVQPHVYRPGETRDSETWQFGVLELATGGVGVFSFSTLGYGSPLRWAREKCAVRFYGERGMGHGDDLAVLGDGDVTLPIAVRRHTDTIDGSQVLAALEADIADGVCWVNPLREYALADGDQHAPLTIGLQLLSIYRAIAEDAPAEYTPEQARLDRALDLAIAESWNDGGRAIRVGAIDRAQTP